MTPQSPVKKSQEIKTSQGSFQDAQGFKVLAISGRFLRFRGSISASKLMIINSGPFRLVFKVDMNTLPKTNIAPENWWLEGDPFLLGFGPFSGSMLNFAGVSAKPWIFG